MIAGVLLRVALLAASMTWMNWGYLHTVGDHTRGEQIATAVLENPEARHELASPVANQLRHIGDLPDDATDELTVAVAAVLADPAISDDLVGAFAASHARLLGVPDERSTTVDASAISVAVHRRLDETTPELAERVPNDIDLSIDLPVLQLPYADDIRGVARTTLIWTSIVTAVASASAFLLGSRRRVLRRLGIWAVVTGSLSFAVAKLWVLAARTLVPPLDATLQTGIETATAPVVDAGWILVLAGVAAIAISMLLSATTAPAHEHDAPRAARSTEPAARTQARSPGTGFWEARDVAGRSHDRRPSRPTPPATHTKPTEPTAQAAQATVQTGRRAGERRWAVAADGSVVATTTTDIDTTAHPR